MGGAVFTPAVLAMQTAKGSTIGRITFPDRLTAALRDFLAERDSACLATANADGQPTVQHRGGPPGFIRPIDDRTIGFADFRGNRQFISFGNISENPQVCLLLIDYEQRRRVKIWGEASLTQDAAMIERLRPEAWPGHIHAALLIRITAWDDNCPAHIPRLVPAAAVAARVATLEARIAELERENFRLYSALRAAPDGGS